MTPNETLRAILDERGVDWDYGITGATTTRFSVNGIDLTFTPMRDGLVCSTILTPEKVIAATLGRRTCHIEQVCHERIAGCDNYHDEFACSECGSDMFEHFNFCPNCGRKVVGE